MKLSDMLFANAMMGEGGGGGGGDFSTAAVKVINNTNDHIKCSGLCILDEEYGMSAIPEIYNNSIEDDLVVLYKGKAVIYLVDNGSTVTVSGNITAYGDGSYDVTGNGTITIS